MPALPKEGQRLACFTHRVCSLDNSPLQPGLVSSIVFLSFHHPKRKMRCPRRLKRPYVFQVNRFRANMIKETNALTQKHMRDIHMKLIEQTRLQSLLNRATPMKAPVFLAP